MSGYAGRKDQTPQRNAGTSYRTSRQQSHFPMSGGGTPASADAPRSLDHLNASHSPLKLFVQAKKKINGIFVEVQQYAKESQMFLEDHGKINNLCDENHSNKIHENAEKASGIIEVLKRDHMKVVFFGRTSNGKSTVINAMLKKKILPSGIGHTTNCFVQIEGTDSQEPYLLTEASDTRLSVESVSQLAHALCTEKLGESSLVRVVWPSQQCHLLKDDVVLVDSPGIDVSPDLDSWIDKYCLDADVFVLVANAESTLMQAEKNFFHKVSQRLSKPNIFVLNNRWDASAQEPDTVDQVKEQHLDRNINFLSEELKVVSKSDARDRVFFVSAREALALRIPKGSPGTPLGTLADGYQARLMEFQDFEKKCEICLSKTAVKTKFEQHSLQGKMINQELYELMDGIYQRALRQRQDSCKLQNEKKDYIDFISRQLELISRDIKERILSIVEVVTKEVGYNMSEEIKKLPALIDQFERPFHSEPIVLDAYKKELFSYVKNGLGKNLDMNCSATLETSVDSIKAEMADRLKVLVSCDSKQELLNLPKKDFQIPYFINFNETLFAEFREDIDFRFSYGFPALMKRFLGPRYAHRLAMMGYAEPKGYVTPPPLTPQKPSNPAPGGELLLAGGDAGRVQYQQQHGAGGMSEVGGGGGGVMLAGGGATMLEEGPDVMIALMSQAASLTSRATMSVLIVSGVLWRAVGWKVLAVTVAGYGLLYVYERLTYTNRAKESKFKQQYVDYVTHKLKLIVDSTSSACSNQIQQELSMTFSELSRIVDLSKQELKSEVEELDKAINQLEDAEKIAKKLRNKADFLDHELDSFIHQYLKIT